MSNKKKMNEMTPAGAIQTPAGDFFKNRRKKRKSNPNQPFVEVAVNEKTYKNAFSPGGAAVIEPTSKSKKSKGIKLPKTKVKIAKFENKSESILRESIRNLIFLNRVKYHEEQALREMQEQKLRKVIRYLLNEEDDAVARSLDTTGQTSAYEWLQKIETTTFKNSFLSLVTSRRQRRAFKKVYLTGVKIYLDALDEKYYILNPDKRTLSTPAPGALPANPAATAQPGTLSEQEQVNPAAAPVANTTKASTDSMQDQAITSAITAAGLASAEDEEDINQAVKKAKECLKQDLAQIDDLYFDLSLTNFTTQKGRQTSDRKDFRMFLIGDQTTVGNLQINFDKYNKDKPITNQFPNDIPEESQGEAPILDMPNSQTAQPPEQTSTTPETPEEQLPTQGDLGDTEEQSPV